MLADNRDLPRRPNAHGIAMGWVLPSFVAILIALFSSPARADILDQSGNVIPGTSGLNAEPFVNLSFLDLSNASLGFSDLYSANLSNSTLILANLESANLISANLSAATFDTATLSGGAFLSNAHIATANFSSVTNRGFNESMLQSTKSFATKDLIGVGIGSNDMSGWDLSHQNLTSANLTLGTYSFFFDNSLGTYTIATNFAESNLASVVGQASNFGNRNLGLPTFSGATFTNANLASVNFSNSTFTGANLTSANLSFATFSNATFSTGGTSNFANFTDATVNFANFSSTVARGFRKTQLYDTASYKNKDLRGINLSLNDLTVGGTWDLSSQDLRNANFSSATLSTSTFTTNFSNASVNFANFSSTTGVRGFTFAQLQSTASYGSLDLTGINLSSNALNGWNFSNQNLSSVNFSAATLTSANFNGATINFANFSQPNAQGLTFAQLQQTASWAANDFQGLNLSGNNLAASSGWNFSGKNVSSVNFSSATLSAVGTGLGPANFTGATVNFANFSSTTSRGLTFALLQSTANFQNLDFSGINLSQNTMTGTNAWDFTGFKLSSASFMSSNLSAATFSGATLNLANMTGANLTGATLNSTDLTSATLSAANATTASFAGATLAFANATNANLSAANFTSADLTNANFTGAVFGTSTLNQANLLHALIKGATLSFATSHGFVDQMLYQTDSYQVDKDLSGLNLSNNDLTSWKLGDGTAHSGMNLTSVSFASSTLTNAEFTDATIAFANFAGTVSRNFTFGQLAQSKSFAVFDLQGIGLSQNDLSSWDFSGQNLASADFSNASLSAGGTSNFAAFTGAQIVGANFSSTTAKGFVKEQLYVTQSYVDGNLSHVNLSFNNLAPVDSITFNALPAWDLHGQNLTGASFDSDVLANSGGSVDFTGAKIKDASFNFTTNKGFTFAQLQSTETWINHDLGAIGLGSNNLSGWDLSNQNLNKANFAIATLGSNATLALGSTDFSGARIAGANFTHTTPFGFSRDQLESTFSWPNHSLGSINLSQNNLGPEDPTLPYDITIPFLDNGSLSRGWDFSGQQMPKSNFSSSLLARANFNDALLHDANFTNAGLILTRFDRADLRGAKGFTGATLSLTNTILPDGTLHDLHLNGTPSNGTTLNIRDYNGSSSIPIHVTGGMTLTSASDLVVRLHDGNWGSTISFDPGIPVNLAGVLDLGMDDTAILTDIYSYPGHARPIQLFAWNSSPGSTFDSITKDSRFRWDTSDLYVGGTILVDGLYGDVNYDGRVDVADLGIMGAHYLQATTLWKDGDLNGDGIVDIIDLKLMADNWNYGNIDPTVTPPALGPLLTALHLPMVSVPEPVIAGPLMVLGALVMRRRQRR